MSFDFNFRVTCDHKVKRERLSFEMDNQTILLPRAVSALNGFSFFLDGDEIDSTEYSLGVKHSYGDTVAQGSDVLFFEAGKEYTLRELDIEVSSLDFRNFLSLTDSSFSSDIFEVYVDEDSRTHLVCSETASVLNNTLILVYYNYLPTFVETYSYDQLVLTYSKMVNGDSLPEISYATTIDNCRKCNETGLINDFSLNAVGNLQTIVDTDKLLQDAYIFTFTVKGSDPEYPQIGTMLLELVGSRYLGDSTRGAIQIDIRESLSLFQNLQRSQSRVQPLSEAEILNNFKKAEVVQDSSDLTKFYIKIRLSSLTESDLEVNSISSFNRIA